MLRRFKADFFTTLNHDLRSPINNQVSSLEIVLADLHESKAEMREFITEAQRAAKHHLELVEACIAVGKYCPPVRALQPRSQSLLPILQRVHQLTSLQARTRLITYAPISAEIIPASVTAWIDDAGLEQVLLGLLSWAIASFSRGCLSFSFNIAAETVMLTWEMTGDLSEAIRDPARASHLNWVVAQNLLAATHGRAMLVDRSPESGCSIQCVLARQQPE
ncbi:MAG: hypothetical protein AAFX40_00950 [Cyanobacteria bacterium J06639_1]